VTFYGVGVVIFPGAADRKIKLSRGIQRCSTECESGVRPGCLEGPFSLQEGVLGLVHTSDAIGNRVEIGSARNVILRSSVNQKVELEAESEARRNLSQKDQESFLFLPIPLPLPSLPSC